jgi:hypothetical protein
MQATERAGQTCEAAEQRESLASVFGCPVNLTAPQFAPFSQNYVYYELAAKRSLPVGCKSSDGNATDGNCIFYNATQGDIDVNCGGTELLWSRRRKPRRAAFFGGIIRFQAPLGGS